MERTAPTGEAQRGVVEALAGLGLPIVGEEGGRVARAPGWDDRWIALDPIDGTRNYRAARSPWAISIGLVSGGLPLAGLVADLSGGRRWWGDREAAFADGRRIRVQPGDVIGLPSPRPGEALSVPSGFERLRVSGCTSIDICSVADGSLAAFDGSRSGSIYVQDVAAALAILAGAGGVSAGAESLQPDPESRLRVLAAADVAALGSLRREPEPSAQLR